MASTTQPTPGDPGVARRGITTDTGHDGERDSDSATEIQEALEGAPGRITGARRRRLPADDGSEEPLFLNEWSY